jgi:ectoine hydroxylase-related dioxygenase (phytanoyl-CoA dioxygenase family)
MNTILTSLAHDGYAIVPQALAQDELSQLIAAVDVLVPPNDDRNHGGLRDLFGSLPATRELAAQPAVRRWPSEVLGAECFAMRAILFDKTPEANWNVAWHQDVTIPVCERLDVPGYGSWSRKAGIVHVQPPVAILERMLTVRVHLDLCGLDNGPLRVLPGSHVHGKLSPSQIDGWKAAAQPVATPCPAGGLLLMHPLLVHASSRSDRPDRRRVIHLEFAVDPLPAGLEWYERR